MEATEGGAFGGRGATVNGAAWIAASAAVVALLGAVHLVMLYFTPKLRPVDSETTGVLKRTTLPLSDTTNMWRAWLGFNTSHAFGAVSFGAVYLYLALAAPSTLFDGPYLCLVGLAYLLGMLSASARYWFIQPTIGISVATCAFGVGAFIAVIG